VRGDADGALPDCLNSPGPPRSGRSSRRDASRRSSARSAHVASTLHLPQLLLQVPELIPEPRREFELEFARGLQHLLVEVGDDRLELVRTGGTDALTAQIRRGRATTSTVTRAAAREQRGGVS